MGLFDWVVKRRRQQTEAAIAQLNARRSAPAARAAYLELLEQLRANVHDSQTIIAQAAGCTPSSSLGVALEEALDGRGQ